MKAKITRIMAFFSDYTDVPRAWGVAPTKDLAEAEARRQLESYCKRQGAFEPNLRDPESYTLHFKNVEG